MINLYSDLLLKNIFFIQDEALSIDTDNQIVMTKGHKFSYAKLIIAMGAQVDTSLVPGLAEAAFDVESMESVCQVAID